ncbi:hypothetical protein P692DRAFT_20742941 [Suillus brevipes Sb2]|nr:hypothetical protein P692DRAFT_20742941 [Suillus brevipes Sb2]
MPPSRSKSDRQNQAKKPYNLRSSESPSKSSVQSCTTSSSPTSSISSMSTNDSDELSSLRLEIRTACKELAKIRRERDDITVMNQDLLQAADEALQCPVCHSVIDKPFTRVNLILNRLQWREEKLPEKFKNHLEPFTKAEVQTLCDGKDSILPGRYYECPMCRGFINDAPIEIPVFRDVVSIISEALGPDVQFADQTKPADPTAPWAVFFRN